MTIWLSNKGDPFQIRNEGTNEDSIWKHCLPNDSLIKKLVRNRMADQKLFSFTVEVWGQKVERKIGKQIEPTFFS